MNLSRIARMAHGVNTAYSVSIGDNSQADWDALTPGEQQIVMDGVRYHVTNPSAQPSDSHDSWMACKASAGWKYGEKKCADAKTHPSMVSFDSLPEAEKVKDHLFRSVIREYVMALKREGIDS